VEAKGILVDSSLIIDYFRKEKKSNSPLYSLFPHNDPLHISVLTIYELLCGAHNQKLYSDTEKIIALFNVLEFGQREAVIASTSFRKLKKSNDLIETVDILIAATAKSHHLTVATLNKNHFQRFSDIELVNF
jgi:tRNA(fMet)-specific endonuclease VapC